MQTANVILDRQIHPSKGESSHKSVALETHQDSLSKVGDALPQLNEKACRQPPQ